MAQHTVTREQLEEDREDFERIRKYERRVLKDGGAIPREQQAHLDARRLKSRFAGGTPSAEHEERGK